MNARRHRYRIGVVSLLFVASIPSLSTAHAKSQSLCVNPGGTAGCTTTISGAVAQITGSAATISVAPGPPYVDNVLINTGAMPRKLTLVITGTAGAGSTSVDGNGTGSVFTIGPRASVSLNGLTIQNGSGGPIAPGSATSAGGGIFVNEGSLAVTDCVVTSNHAVFGAGISAVDGTVTITSSRIVDNTSASNGSAGGGIYFAGARARKLKVRTSTIDSNSAAFGGGVALVANGRSELAGNVDQSTISDNSSFATSEGAGMFIQFARLKMTNTTVSGNTSIAGTGGGLLTRSGSSVTLNNVTIADNSAATIGAASSSTSTTRLSSSKIRSSRTTARQWARTVSGPSPRTTTT